MSGTFDSNNINDNKDNDQKTTEIHFVFFHQRDTVEANTDLKQINKGITTSNQQ